MPRLGLWVGMCVLSVAALVLSPAWSAAPEGAKKTKSGEAPAPEDTLVRYYSSDPDYINPLLASDTVSSEFMNNTYETLAQPKYANPDEMEPVLAEKWEFDKKALEFTIHLRKGVKWQPINLPSGKTLEPKEFTARDVKFTFDCILNPNTLIPGLRSYYENPDAKDATDKYMIKVTVIDNSTVKVKWTKPYFLMEEFTLNVPMIPRHVFSVNEQGKPISFDFLSKEFATGFNTHWANGRMCGTGPLILKEWSKGERVLLERNPGYWGQPYFFSKVLFKSITNSATSKEMLKNGEIDWGVIPEKDQFLLVKEHQNAKEGKIVPLSYDFPAYRYIGYNFKRDFLKDKKVRQALSHAINLDDIVEKVLKGLAKRTTGIALPGSSSYDASLPPIPYDLDKARKLLDEAGWVDADNDGVREKKINGQMIKASYNLIIFDNSPTFEQVAGIVKENNRKIGVQVSITPTKWDLMLQKLRKRDFDACMLGWALSWKSDPFQIWHSSQADVPDSSNAIAYANPEVDKLIEELRTTLDVDKQNEIYKKIHRAIYEDQPYTFLFCEKRTGTYNARLKNIRIYKIRPCFDDTEWTATTPRMAAQ